MTAGDREGAPTFYRTIALDAVTKANHFDSCGTASKDLQPRLNTFFSDADAEVQTLHKAGKLHLTGVMSCAAHGDAGDGAPDDADADEDVQCTTSLSCSRPTSTSRGSGVCDVTGMLGTTCSHSIPVCGGFVDMLGPEQFAYYLLTLKSLILQVRVMTVVTAWR